MDLNYSIIIPVYNRPQEIEELLECLINQTYNRKFEVIIVEDGSSIRCKDVVERFMNKLNIHYLFKENSGPGQSRNKGMELAKGNYYIILDSDVLLPKEYLKQIDIALQKKYTDAFGSSDAAHKSFSLIQKAINYSMTAFLTTGGLRNNGNSDKFQLRSFNMGISKKAFLKTKGFSPQNYGEDIDLTYKLWNHKFKTQFIPNAYVYHKRRTDLKQFYKQTFNFGSARPILNKQHLKSAKLTYWFPSVFTIGFLVAVLFLFFNSYILYYLYNLYFCILFFDAVLKNKNVQVGLVSVITTIIQFFGYGIGFLKSQFRLQILNKTIKETFPKMFSPK